MSGSHPEHCRLSAGQTLNSTAISEQPDTSCMYICTVCVVHAQTLPHCWIKQHWGCFGAQSPSFPCCRTAGLVPALTVGHQIKSLWGKIQTSSHSHSSTRLMAQPTRRSLWGCISFVNSSVPRNVLGTGIVYYARKLSEVPGARVIVFWGKQGASS